MTLNLVSELWSELSTHIQYADRSEAAETLISFLIDNDFQAEDIKDAFRGQREVLTALTVYNESLDLDDDHDDYYDDEYDDE